MNENLKAAASYIQSAIDDKLREIAALRKDTQHVEVDVKHHIQDVHTQIRAVEADVARAQDNQNDPNLSRAQKLQQVNNLQRTISHEEADLNTKRHRTQDDIRRLEKDISDLQQVLQDINNKW